jgi:hypothetical protein
MRNTLLAAFAILASGCSAQGLVPEAADDPPPSSRPGPDPADEPDSESVAVAVSDWIIWGPSPTGHVDDGDEDLATADVPREVAP